MPRSDDGKSKTGAALSKSLEVMELLAAEARPLALADLARRLSRPKQTVHRVVRQLEAEGLIIREPVGERYLVGPRLDSLALSALSASFRSTPRHLLLEQLVAEVGESCNLGILDGDAVLYLDRVECDWPLRWHLKPGSRVPLHSTSLGKLLLAELPARARRRLLERLPLPRFTDRTITDAGRLEEECRAIAKRGYASNSQESQAGLISVAVPLRLGDGPAIAGLALHAPLVRMKLEAAKQHIPLLRDYAAKIAEAYRAEAEG